jgi:hypothetical protein
MQQLPFQKVQIEIVSQGRLDVDNSSEGPAENATKHGPPKNIVESFGTPLQSKHCFFEDFQSFYGCFGVKTIGSIH